MDALLLHQPADADDARTSGLMTPTTRLIATHASVVDHLAQQGQAVEFLQALLAPTPLRQRYDLAAQIVEQSCAVIDAHLTMPLAQRFKLPPIPWAAAALRYPALLDTATLMCWEEGLQQLARQGVSRLIMYEGSTAGQLPASSSLLAAAAARIAAETGMQTVLHPAPVLPPPPAGTLPLRQRLRRLWRQPHLLPLGVQRRWQSHQLRKLARTAPASSGTVVLLEGLYELAGVAPRIPRLVLWPRTGLPAWAHAPTLPATQSLADLLPALPRTAPAARQAWLEWECQRRLTDFLATHGAAWLPAITALHELLQRQAIDALIWGLPPVDPPTGILAALARAHGVPRIGMQHGGQYETQDFGDLHWWSDYLHCDHFLSFGFVQQQLRWQGWAPPQGLRVHPIGSLRCWYDRQRPPRPAAAARVDLLYCISFSFGDCMPLIVRADLIHAWRVQLLQFLSTAKARVMVKLPPHMHDGNFAPRALLQRLPHLELCDDLSFRDALQAFSPRAVVLDMMGTPLYECMARDTEIFQLLDPEAPLRAEVATTLARRVHLATNVEAMIAHLRSFLDDTLPALRDDAFMHQQVLPPGDPRDRLLATIAAVRRSPS